MFFLPVFDRLTILSEGFFAEEIRNCLFHVVARHPCEYDYAPACRHWYCPLCGTVFGDTADYAVNCYPYHSDDCPYRKAIEIIARAIHRFYLNEGEDVGRWVEVDETQKTCWRMLAIKLAKQKTGYD